MIEPKHFRSINDIKLRVSELRRKLEAEFSAETAYRGTIGSPSSYGHCAAVAAVLFESLGGELVSATVNGISHWFNRFPVGGRQFDVDITGDQFGRAPIQIGPQGELYRGTRLRAQRELDEDTLARAERLRERARLIRKYKRRSSRTASHAEQ